MFEKSLVDLIRGLRGHKGSEAEYIQGAIKECRAEIRSQDMDVKATAVLKLIYLEMFGYDMTWAAFNVLEVMSSAKQHLKRTGYLAAVQSFRPDTEILMLAENLLKKDLSSPSIPVLSLPLVTLPHIITSSLALSILSDLLPRLSHSQPAVRKKTLVTLYRLALVYPETLRVAWPKIKDRLLDEREDSSVTAATINVVCELGWRRPQDFLPLAPRLFDLLIEGGNNWMAIKIIKLFAILTPLEPRLMKKLVRPLTNLIQKTSAMSLLYECINGIIQGGILDGAESGVDVEEVASLCISKLRGMIVVEGDPNLKYVALLAFNKVVTSHPMLVSRQQDVILRCLDDPDISIKMQALELVSGMVSSDNLQSVVDRLLKQLARVPTAAADAGINGHAEDMESTDLEQKLTPDKRGSETQPLPDEYRHEVITRILDMCSTNTYANISDFEWYIEVLVQLVRHLPARKTSELTSTRSTPKDGVSALALRIGSQLLDIAVRVKELRAETTKACESLLFISNRNTLFASHGSGLNEVLKTAAWVCGEFPSYLTSPYDVLNTLVHDSSRTLQPSTLSSYIQNIPKVYTHIVSGASRDWNASRRTTQSLLLARILAFLEDLSAHPNLEVQERSVEFLELLKVASEALSSQEHDALEAPLLLTSAVPGLFSGMDLNPVSSAAQKKVPLPSDLDLEAPINPDLNNILQSSQTADDTDEDYTVFESFYHDREPVTTTATTLQPSNTSRLPEPTESEPISYQSAPESPTTISRRKAERRARARDDPFYIPSGGSSPIHNVLSESNGVDFDIDSIPIIDLQIDPTQTQPQSASPQKRKKKPLRKFVVAADETLDPSLSSDSGTPQRSASPATATRQARPTRNLLTVDSSDLRAFSLEGSDNDYTTKLDIERREAEEAEMAAAIREVEQKRLEMQREIERQGTQVAEGVDVEGTVVKRKKKKKVVKEADDRKGVGGADAEEGEEKEVVKKKKKKKKGPVVAEGEKMRGIVDE